MLSDEAISSIIHVQAKNHHDFRAPSARLSHAVLDIVLHHQHAWNQPRVACYDVWVVRPFHKVSYVVREQQGEEAERI